MLQLGQEQYKKLRLTSRSDEELHQIINVCISKSKLFKQCSYLQHVILVPHLTATFPLWYDGLQIESSYDTFPQNCFQTFAMTSSGLIYIMHVIYIRPFRDIKMSNLGMQIIFSKEEGHHNKNGFALYISIWVKSGMVFRKRKGQNGALTTCTIVTIFFPFRHKSKFCTFQANSSWSLVCGNISQYLQQLSNMQFTVKNFSVHKFKRI